jgi:hypothetical protein
MLKSGPAVKDKYLDSKCKNRFRNRRMTPNDVGKIGELKHTRIGEVQNITALIVRKGKLRENLKMTDLVVVYKSRTDSFTPDSGGTNNTDDEDDRFHEKNVSGDRYVDAVRFLFLKVERYVQEFDLKEEVPPKVFYMPRESDSDDDSFGGIPSEADYSDTIVSDKSSSDAESSAGEESRGDDYSSTRSERGSEVGSTKDDTSSDDGGECSYARMTTGGKADLNNMRASSSHGPDESNECSGAKRAKPDKERH